MTILGKILAIVNLVFSLVTAALIVMVFLTRTNWKNAYDGLESRYKVSQANAQAYAQETIAAKKDYDARLEEKERAIAKLTGERDNEKNAAQAKQTELDKIKERVTASEAGIEKATQELKRRELEVANLTQVNEAKNAKILDLEKANHDYRDQAVSAEINYNSEHQRNTRLLTQLEKLSKDNERLQQSRAGAGGSSAVTRKPPPEDVKGRILDIDPKSGLATISVGSDSGISVGNTLEVYHLTPKPEYVGTVRVVDAHFKQAVVRPVLPLRAGPLQKDDIVASRILASR